MVTATGAMNTMQIIDMAEAVMFPSHSVAASKAAR